MSKGFLIVMVLAQAMLAIGLGEMSGVLHKNQSATNRELKRLAGLLEQKRTQLQQDAQWRSDMDDKLSVVGETQRVIVDESKTFAQRQAVERISQQLSSQIEEQRKAGQEIKTLTEQKLAGIRDKIELMVSLAQAKTEIVPLRWAYVDKFKLKRAAESLVKPEPLDVAQDPEKNPELSKLLAEYNGIHIKLSQLNPAGMIPGRPTGETEGKEIQDLQLRLAEIKPSLTAYLNRNSDMAAKREDVIEQALRKFAVGKFDLLMDKTFGNHHIHYRSDHPVPDVTDGVLDVLKEMVRL